MSTGSDDSFAKRMQETTKSLEGGNPNITDGFDPVPRPFPVPLEARLRYGEGISHLDRPSQRTDKAVAIPAGHIALKGDFTAPVE